MVNNIRYIFLPISFLLITAWFSYQVFNKFGYETSNERNSLRRYARYDARVSDFRELKIDNFTTPTYVDLRRLEYPSTNLERSRILDFAYFSREKNARQRELNRFFLEADSRERVFRNARVERFNTDFTRRKLPSERRKESNAMEVFFRTEREFELRRREDKPRREVRERVMSSRNRENRRFGEGWSREADRRRIRNRMMDLRRRRVDRSEREMRSRNLEKDYSGNKWLHGDFLYSNGVSLLGCLLIFEILSGFTRDKSHKEGSKKDIQNLIYNVTPVKGY